MCRLTKVPVVLVVALSLLVAACDRRGVLDGRRYASSPSGEVGAPPPAATKQFSTLRPGASLPSGPACEQRLRATGWEPRPQNVVANHNERNWGPIEVTVATDAYNRRYASRIRGDFSGTTDELIQWAACKWGVDEDLTRARVVTESFWRQGQLGDIGRDRDWCSTIGQSTPCYESYALLQIRVKFFDGRLWPGIVQSTALGLDYALAHHRACLEGELTWLDNGYGPGDEWGCVGLWFTGEWKSSGESGYIAEVRKHLRDRTWEQDHFLSVTD